MKLFITISFDEIKQVRSPNDAACLRFIEQKACKLFEIDIARNTIKPVKIPEIEFADAGI